ncbi:DUF6520 family protein [Flagellimonas algicola]|uniref:Secreted protein n=1 Tax=Flagellimonas algicola TaxID=2583815 RepID=A0ABY2WGQ8_9FLAO|nr:DUF6520 family protein [Allomuricauda algicola]TMU50749.1 hypothetical protein FGG15_18300 [Allomuricauda algicola]
MKTKILKFILPAFAIIMAVGLAFATDESNATQTGYYNHPILGVQSISTDCPDFGTVQCMEGPYQVFKDQNLTIPLYEPRE